MYNMSLHIVYGRSQLNIFSNKITIIKFKYSLKAYVVPRDATLKIRWPTTEMPTPSNEKYECPEKNG